MTPTDDTARHEEPPVAEREPQALRLMTWNLWWRFGDWQRRTDAIADILADEQPDICGLQEVWAEPSGRHQLDELGDRLGYHWVWAPRAHPQRWQRRVDDSSSCCLIGNAVLSRWPLGDPTLVPISDADLPEGPHLLVVDADTPWGPLTVATTHLTSALGGSRLRCAQVSDIVRHLSTRPPTPWPLVLTGDLNAYPDSDEVRLLEGHRTAPVVNDFVLVDAWRFAEAGDLGFSWDRANPYVAGTGEPSARCDYVLLTPPTTGNGHVLRARLGANASNGVWASDHAPVVVDLAVSAGD